MSPFSSSETISPFRVSFSLRPRSLSFNPSHVVSLFHSLSLPLVGGRRRFPCLWKKEKKKSKTKQNSLLPSLCPVFSVPDTFQLQIYVLFQYIHTFPLRLKLFVRWHKKLRYHFLFVLRLLSFLKGGTFRYIIFFVFYKIFYKYKNYTKLSSDKENSSTTTVVVSKI